MAISDPTLDATVRRVLQRIRAGWLPHYVGPPQRGSWWWGRPSQSDGFALWASGLVPSMAVVETMAEDEIELWTRSLHPLAPEVGRIG